ncbi:hypothetical protein E0V51_23280 [Salmonella enterica subsp. enterica serovar Hvittingfoss]|nr:hypothetical protein [Salmonella enterica subsp. enterica serovar Hvittingfoss]
MIEKKYSYNSITAATENALNKYICDALACPQKAEIFQAGFNGAFWLWFDLTRDEPSEDRDADGTRFLDLILKFPEESLNED